jgi:hypothetical protein
VSDVAAAAAIAHVTTTALYAGFQATVRLLVYPQMDAVPAAAFAGYEASHTRRVGRLVGPLFAAVAATTLGLLLVPGVPPAGAAAAAAGFAGILAVTAFGAVPQHARLGAGFDHAAHRRLLRWDTVRLLLALAGLGVAVLTLVVSR